MGKCPPAIEIGEDHDRRKGQGGIQATDVTLFHNYRVVATQVGRLDNVTSYTQICAHLCVHDRHVLM